MKRIQELDGLRAIAIILVIGCHYEVFARQLWGLPKFGWVGVDIFFVLSGFLITSVLLNLRGRERPFKAFYARRFRRITPPYVMFLVLAYAVTGAFHDHALYRVRIGIINLFFLQSFASVLKTLHPMLSGGNLSLAHSSLEVALPQLTGPVSKAWGVLWSLSVEEYFYLLWAPAVLWMNKRWTAYTGVTICLGAFAIRWLGFVGHGTYYSILHRFDAPVFGALVALLIASEIPRRSVNVALVVAGLLGAATLIAVLVPMGNVLNKEVRDDHIFSVFGIPALSLIAAAVVGLSVTASGAKGLFLLRSTVLGFVGKVSYTLYLLHGFVYLIFLHFFQPTWLVSITALVCAVGLSWISWTYLEQPILEAQYAKTNKTLANYRPARASGPKPDGDVTAADRLLPFNPQQKASLKL